MLFEHAIRKLEPTWLRLGTALVLSGISNAAILYFVSESFDAAPESAFRIFIGFIIVCAAYAIYLRYSASVIAKALESIVFEIRSRIARKLCGVELDDLTRYAAADLCDEITREAGLIASSSWALVLALHSSIMLVMSSIYVGKLSPIAFLMVMVLYGGGGYLYYTRRRAVRRAMEEAAKKQKGILRALEDVFQGAKELRMNSNRRAALLDNIRTVASTLKEAPARINWLSHQRMLIGKAYLFLLMAALVFVLPYFADHGSSSLGTVLAAVILMFNPLRDIQVAMPEYERADHALERVTGLELRLDEMLSRQPSTRSDPFGSEFTELRAEGLRYEHRDETGRTCFSLGPLSLSIRAGEIVFFIGNNGSGKTTLFKLLTALYPPTSGTLRINGTEVDPSNRQAYRERISAIFSDFHLFKRLYGLSQVQPERAQALIDKLQLTERVTLQDGEFSSLALSTGQRKRLALVVALLEDRPVYFFDEWAADQDPEFRRYYYEELLPELRQKGKTVLAITHDDRYFGCADRVIKLEYGALKETYAPPGLAGREDRTV